MDNDPYEDLLLVAVLRESQDIQNGIWHFIVTRDASAMDASVKRWLLQHAESTREHFESVIAGIERIQADMSRGGT